MVSKHDLGSCRHTLGPQARLRRTAEIADCRNRGEKLYSKHFLIIPAPSTQSVSRLAVAVTTKIEKRATVRNLIKRRIREIFRKHRHDLTKALDILVVARREIQSCDFNDYKREILGTLRHRGYLPPKAAKG